MDSMATTRELLVATCLCLSACPGRAQEQPSSSTQTQAPAFAWTLSLAEDPESEELRDGTLYAVGPTTVFAIRDGKVLWARDTGGTGGWHLFLASGCLLTGDGNGLVCLDPTTGEPRWRVADAVTWAHPEPGIKLTGPAARAPGGAVVFLDGSRLYALDEAACIASDASCLQQKSTLPEWYRARHMFATADGTRVYSYTKGGGTGHIRIERADGALVADIAVGGSPAPLLTPDGRIVALIDDTPVVLDPAACSGDVAAPGPPCTQPLAAPKPPESHWRYLSALEDGTVVLHSDLAFAVVGRNWTRDALAHGMSGADGRIYGIESAGGILGGAGHHVVAFAAEDGAPLWRVAISKGPSRPGFHRGGRTLVGDKLVWVLLHEHVAALPHRPPG